MSPIAAVRLDSGKLLAIRIGRFVAYTGKRNGRVNTPAGCVVPYRGKRYVAKPIYFHHYSRWTWRWLWIRLPRQAKERP